MKLVGKRRPHALAVDPRAPLDGHEVSGEQPLLDRLAHLRITRVQPVSGPVEREALDQIGAAEAPEPILRFEEDATVPELPRAGQAGQSAADDDGSPTPAHITPRLYHENHRRFVGGSGIPMLAWPKCHERDAVQPGAPRPQTSLGDGRRGGRRLVKISCPSCSAAYELDDGRVPPSGLNIKCPKCKNAFTVHRPKGDGAKPAAKPASTASGPAAAKAPASKPPVMKPVAAKPQTGAIPLPGMADGSSAAPPALSDLDPPAA